MRIVKWYYRLNQLNKSIIYSVLAAIGFFLSAFIPNEIVNYLLPMTSFKKVLIYIGIFIIILIIYAAIFSYFKYNIEKIEDEIKKENELILSAYIKCDKIVTDTMQLFNDKSTIDNLLVGTPLESIKELIDSVYEVFDDYYGRSINPNDRIKFEATFMSKSYIDDEITIPASKNRENRTPTSLHLRQTNKILYNNTITATIYRETRPSIHIIEDTCDPKSGYEELYPTQQKRILSSIVFPVLSNENKLLGTLVVHCDKKGFFKQDKSKFWIELLEIFAKRLAYEKLRLDMLVKNAAVHSIDISEMGNIF